MRLSTAKGGLLAGAAALMLAVPASAQEISLWTLSFSDVQRINDGFAKLEQQFEAEHPGVDLKIVRRGTDEHKTALRVATGAERGPDVYFMWAGLGLGGEFVKAGLSQDLTPYYEKYDWADVLVGSSMGFVEQFGEGMHGAPYTFKGEVVYYNKKLFEQAGIDEEPQTYEELVETAKKLKDAGIPAFTFGGTVNWHVMRLMDVLLETTCGAEKHDALIGMELDWTEEPCATKAFEEMKMWATEYFLAPFMGIDNAQSTSLFFADRAAMMLEGNWLVDQIKEGADLSNFGIFPFPTGTGRLYGFAEYHYINAKSEHKDLAAELIDLYLSEDFQQETLGAFATTSVNKNVEYVGDISDMEREWLDVFANHTELFVNGDQGFPLDVTTEYFRVINEVASGNLEPAAAAQAMQTFIESNT
ncbi:ABC transporter substrate-binding protein [Chelativorans xinjiangense]|uniref:ABC transporter substrate-binding protein n=1 Tax=Chelativorans xinjiangense TaxID=2681485 RepID=UPI001356B2CB|nr:extracellular solute-binding protein [Chelativorans xinjiangense]